MHCKRKQDIGWNFQKQSTIIHFSPDQIWELDDFCWFEFYNQMYLVIKNILAKKIIKRNPQNSNMYLWNLKIQNSPRLLIFLATDKSRFCESNGILLPKLFWPILRKNCSSDREKLLSFKAEGREFAKFLRSPEQFIQTVKGQKNFC